jgi:hypothetical protein
MDEAPDAIASLAPPAPVDGQAVHCPLCTYDLRGLIEPRCPECGYRFVWTELLDEKRNTHPYLFEHYPRNNIWSFVRTVIGGLNPARFSRTLRPQMTPRPRRLLLYWMVNAVLPLLVAVGLLGTSVAATKFYLPFSPQIPAGSMMMRQFVNGRRHGFVNVSVREPLSFLAPPVFFAAVLVVLWTLSTYLALMVFQDSMAKARIRPIHVARCVGYSFDIGLWCAVAGLAIVALAFCLPGAGMNLGELISCMALVTGALIIFAALRLWAAYRLYLAFDHAFWVVLSSQIISFLLINILLSNLDLLKRL